MELGIALKEIIKCDKSHVNIMLECFYFLSFFHYVLVALCDLHIFLTSRDLNENVLSAPTCCGFDCVLPSQSLEGENTSKEEIARTFLLPLYRRKPKESKHEWILNFYISKNFNQYRNMLKNQKFHVSKVSG